jgi:molybdopterin synthase catalytic subunit
MSKLGSPNFGGTASFVGTVRNHHNGLSVLGLKYSAYVPMAEKEIAIIIAEASSRWPIELLVTHRVGQLLPGDTAIVVVAASAHRSAAFEACRWTVEQVKERAPIWKLERYADGSESWVTPGAARTNGLTGTPR